jgi:RNA polymerase sigma factor (sigma-70 family)
MPRYRLRVQACAVSPDDPEGILLRETQAYLALRATGQTPPARLSAVWNQFYDLYDPLIRHCVRCWHLPEPDSRDCSQEVWLEIVAQLGHLQLGTDSARLRNWIATLARNVAVDLVRERIRHRRTSLSFESLARLTGRESDPADEYERHRTQTLVREALAELASRVSAMSYRVLYLRSVEERTIAEVASQLDLTPEQVRKRHHRMMKKLDQLIGVLAAKSCSGGCLTPPPPTCVHV